MRVVVAEDHVLLRDGLTRLLTAYGFEVLAALEGSEGLADALQRPEAQVAILDVRLPPTFTDEGLRAAIAARRARPGFPVVVLSQYVEHLYARELLASGGGGVGYLLKDRVADTGEFVESVRRVAAGGTALDPDVVATLMNRAVNSPIERLSPREREVLALMAQGRSNQAIADGLFVTEKAVAKHINSIFTKLDLPVDVEDHRRVLAVLAWLKA